MYLDVSDVYPKMYPGLVWDTCKIHAKYQDTCILLECNRAFKIHLGYIRIHERYMYPSGYTQDTSQYIRIRILITNPPKLDNKPPLTPAGAQPTGGALSHRTLRLATGASLARSDTSLAGVTFTPAQPPFTVNSLLGEKTQSEAEETPKATENPVGKTKSTTRSR